MRPPKNTGTVLDRIIEKKRVRLEEAMRETSIEEMKELAAQAPPAGDFRAAISGSEAVSLIAEVKKASPSRGVLREDFHPEELARAYENAGASAISVITEQDFFLGEPEFLQRVKNAVSLPVLRKDFLFHPYQVYESRALGADALLLIVAAIDDETLGRMLRLSGELSMAALVEAHTGEELRRALKAGAEIVGVNNRNLKTMEVDLDVTRELAERVPGGITLVSESGIKTAEDVAALRGIGVNAALVGETLVTSPDPEEAARSLLGGAR